MKITNLTYANFKGHSGAWDLAPVTLIAGSNFAHKTSIPLAIRLALAGHLPPPLGSRRIYELAGNPEGQGQMDITLILDDGRKVPWSWKRDAAGKVSVKGGIGADSAMPELLLDPKLFFAKTANEQIQTVFSACEISHFDPETIKARFREIQVTPMAIAEATIAEVIEWMDTRPIGHAPQWLAEFVDWLKAQAKQANEQAKIASGAFAAFRGEEQFTGTIKDVSAEIAKARAKLSAMERNGGGTAILQARLDALTPQLQRFGAASVTDQCIAELEDWIETSDFAEDEHEDVIAAMEERVTACGYRSKAGDQAAANVEVLKKQHAAIEEADCCPTCYSKKKGWKTEAQSQLLAQLNKAISERDSAHAAAAKAKAELDALKTWLAKAEQLSKLRTEKAELTEIMAQIVKTEAGIKSQSGEQPDTEAITAVKSQIVTLEGQQRQFEAWSRDRQHKERLEKNLLPAQTRAETMKAIVALVIEEQGKLIDKAFGQVLNVAKHFTDGLLNSPLEFVNGSLGRRVSKLDQAARCQAPIGSWIGFDTFSGTEELLALAGFGVALTGDAPVKLVILDELGRLDAKRKLDVALRMLALADSGVIDQAILIDLDSKVYQALANRPNWKVITL